MGVRFLQEQINGANNPFRRTDFVASRVHGSRRSNLMLSTPACSGP